MFRHGPSVRPMRSGPVLLVLLLLCLIAFTGRTAAAENPTGVPARLLLLHSYHPGMTWTEDVTAGLRQTFAGAGLDVQLHTEYLDAKRFPGPDYLNNTLDPLLTRKLRPLHFDLVLAADNDALNFALRHRDELFAGTPLVFCGINAYQAQMLAGYSNVTGVAEQLSFKATIELGLRLHKRTERIVFIGRTDDVSGRLITGRLLQEAAGFRDRVKVVVWNDLLPQRLRESLAALPADSLVFLASNVVTGDGPPLSYEESAHLVRAAARVPIYGFWDFFLDHGVVGGKMASGRTQGEQAARLALRILSGEDPEAVPIVQQDLTTYMFDNRELRRFRIPHELLPEQAVIINQPPSFYTVGKKQAWLILAGVGGLCILSLALARSMHGRRRAELALGQSEERLRLALEGSRDGMWDWDVASGRNLVDDQWCAMLGYSRSEIAENIDQWETLVHPEDLPDIEQAQQKCMDGEISHFSGEFRMRTRSGGWTWILGRGKVVERDRQGTPVRLVGTHKDISQQKEAERALRESEDKFRRLVENAPVAMAISDGGDDISYVNRKFTELFGYVLEEVPTKTEWGRKVYPDAAYRDAVWQQWNSVFDQALRENSEIPPQEFRVRCKEGRSLDISFRSSLIGGREYVVFVDVTARKAAEEALRSSLRETERSRDRIDAILRSIADGLILTDNGGRVVMVNHAAEELLGVRQEEIAGRFAAELIKETSFREHLEAALARGEVAAFDLELFHTGRGEVRVIQVSTSIAQGQDDQPAGLITIFHDVTQAREMDRLKNEFISTAAHELRTPLTAVLGYAELLTSAADFTAEQQQEFLREIGDKADALGRIVDELLDLSRIEAGRLIALDRTPCDLAALITQMVEQYRKFSLDHSFILDVAEKLPEQRLDRGKMVRVLENLLSNAVKYSPAGGQIRLHLGAHSDRCILRIEDEGIGMTPEQVSRIFDKFYRANADNAAVGGLGLGMTIVRSIVEAHGGAIRVESAQNRGTRVFFELPLE